MKAWHNGNEHLIRLFGEFGDSVDVAQNIENLRQDVLSSGFPYRIPKADGSRLIEMIDDGGTYVIKIGYTRKSTESFDLAIETLYKEVM